MGLAYRLATIGVANADADADAGTQIFAYMHLPVTDFHAPTLNQLDQVQQAYTSHISGRTLVYCGYGHGQTGTVIAVLQLYMGWPQTHTDYYANHVEDPSQVAMLDQLKAKLGFNN